jgi:hypothetical protein
VKDKDNKHGTGDSTLRNSLPRVTLKEWAALSAYFGARQRHPISPGMLVTGTGVPMGKAVALLVLLAAEGYGALFLEVFHTCEEHSVATWPFSRGFAPASWFCPECGNVSTESELRYSWHYSPRKKPPFVGGNVESPPTRKRTDRKRRRPPPRVGHSKSTQVRCPICSPLRCCKAGTR